jgi:collagen type VII alpha
MSYNLTGATVSSTYGRIVQVVHGTPDLYYDGFGNLLELGTGTASVGPAGTSGTSGFNGTSGTSGMGTSGTSGLTGTSGTSGTSGFSGTSGTRGTSGLTGTNGTSGTSGLTGTNGTSGSTGPTGATGPSGGLQGDKGGLQYTYNAFFSLPNTGGFTYFTSDGDFYGVIFSQTDNDGNSLSTYFNSILAPAGITAKLYITSNVNGETKIDVWDIDRIDVYDPAPSFFILEGTLLGGIPAFTYLDNCSINIVFAGPTGTNGTSGAQGTRGTSGTSGTRGTSGTSGTSGLSGTSGENGISTGQTYYLNESQNSDVSGYKVLSKEPSDTTTQTLTTNLTGSQQNVLVSDYITPQLGFNVIPGGTQRFHLHYLKPASNDNITAYVEIQLADSSGTPIGPTISSNISLIGWVSNVVPVEVNVDIVLPTTTIVPTNRMIVRLYLSNNTSSSKSVVYYTEGNSYYSFVVTSVGALAGTSGVNGTSGTSGSSGSSGISGVDGLDGTSGTTGTSGISPNAWLYVTRNTNQTIGSGLWSNRDIVFNNQVYSNNITYSTSTGIATLTAGTYRITARLAWSADANYLIQFSLFDSVNNQLGPTVEQIQPTSGVSNTSSGDFDMIYDTASTIDVKIRTLSTTTAQSVEYIRGDLNTQFIIQKI